MEVLPFSLSQHSSHVSFFLCQAHHEWERGETGELFASPPPGGSGRHQPLSLVTEGREQGGEMKCETRGGGVRLLLMCCGVWCQVWYLHYWSGSVLSTLFYHRTPRFPHTNPNLFHDCLLKSLSLTPAIKPRHKWASQLSRCPCTLLRYLQVSHKWVARLAHFEAGHNISVSCTEEVHSTLKLWESQRHLSWVQSMMGMQYSSNYPGSSYFSLTATLSDVPFAPYV